MLNFIEGMGRQLSNVPISRQGGVTEGHGDNFFVDRSLVHHFNDPDGKALHEGQRDDGLLAHHQYVERVAVFGVGTRDESVIGRIVGGGVKHPVQPEQTGFLVELVFVFPALGDFDDSSEIVGPDPFFVDIMPDVLHFGKPPVPCFRMDHPAPKIRRGGNRPWDKEKSCAGGHSSRVYDVLRRRG